MLVLVLVGGGEGCWGGMTMVVEEEVVEVEGQHTAQDGCRESGRNINAATCSGASRSRNRSRRTQE
jgi:hypothetical protein